jgi:tetratricopeptide (TPR) repeat protein
MADASPTLSGLLHVVFLERTGSTPGDSSSDHLGEAAFIVLRLVDLLATDRGASSRDQVFRFQAAATARFCREEVEPGVETDYLIELVRSTTAAHQRRDVGLVAPAMLAYATYLEDAARYEEALDVVQTLERAAGSRVPVDQAVAAALQLGRLNRKVARFDDADAAYDRAAALAAVAGDRRAELLSRLGRANVCWGRGNLAAAERWNREVLKDARAAGERDAEARAEHGLGTVLGARGQPLDALPHYWRAFELYQDETLSLLALHDLGIDLARIGAIDDAERAFRHVVRAAHDHNVLQNSMIELLHCASFRRDRVGFTRWRALCEHELPRMAPNILTDYHLKLGIGLARFGRFERALAEMDQALESARAHGLHEFEFRIDRIRTGLRDVEALVCTGDEPDAAPVAQGAAIDEVSAALATLGG